MSSVNVGYAVSATAETLDRKPPFRGGEARDGLSGCSRRRTTRKQRRTLSRSRPLRVTTTRDPLEALSPVLFRIRFSCRGGFADRDEIDTGTGRSMNKLGNICDRPPRRASLPLPSPPAISTEVYLSIYTGRGRGHRLHARTVRARRALYGDLGVYAACGPMCTRITNAPYGTACRG